ncbi:MAG: gliding motility-associated ABC transporter substrate-binding protein GldG [Chitinophagales bacterium]|nr:gliding motility-associated ABC transporter substrate-binding protein GldG [Chitinophagales bacterium]
MKKISLFNFIIGALVIVILIFLSQQVNYRWDLTKEKRFTLTDATVQLLKNLNSNVEIDVYLEGESLPEGIKKVKDHTKSILEDMRRVSKGKLSYNFIDINQVKDKKKKEELQKDLIQKGVLPVNLEVNSETGYSEKLIFPGAIVKKGNKELGLTILENQMFFGTQDALDNSINFIEYKLINTIDKLNQDHAPTIGFLQGHGEVSVQEVSDFLETISKQNYQFKKIELGKDKLLDGKTDLLVVAKPTRPVSEDDKFLIDQYILRGGKVLWLLDQVIADMDSFRIVPSIFSIPREVNLSDMLFRYGARVNDDLVLDLYCAPVPLVEVIAGNPTTKLYPWVFYPIVRGNQNNPIVKNLNPILFKFPSSIDTIRAEGIQKTVLLSSSNFSRKQNIPFELFLEGARQKPQPALFNQSDIPLAVLLEGKFKSFYERRVVESQRELMSFEGQEILNEASSPSKMIVVGDGDVIVNEIDPSGRPLPLGYYRISRDTYANKDFLLNSIDYLLDHANLLSARNRDISMRILDKAKAQDQKGLWQVLTIGLPLLLLALLGVIFNRSRKRRFS